MYSKIQNFPEFEHFSCSNSDWSKYRANSFKLLTSSDRAPEPFQKLSTCHAQLPIGWSFDRKGSSQHFGKISHSPCLNLFFFSLLRILGISHKSATNNFIKIFVGTGQTFCPIDITNQYLILNVSCDYLLFSIYLTSLIFASP